VNKAEQIYFLDSLAGILIRCFFLPVLVLAVWFVLFLLAGDSSYYVHSYWFDMDWYDYNLVFYYGMAFVKLFAFMAFLFPYIAIRLVIRKRLQSPS